MQEQFQRKKLDEIKLCNVKQLGDLMVVAFTSYNKRNEREGWEFAPHVFLVCIVYMHVAKAESA